MQWEIIVALVIAVPIILFPAAYVWYLNVGAMLLSAKKAREAKPTRREAKEVVDIK